jgi:hypothetical protein
MCITSSTFSSYSSTISNMPNFMWSGDYTRHEQIKRNSIICHKLIIVINKRGFRYRKGDPFQCYKHYLVASELTCIILMKGLNYLSNCSDGALVLICKLHAPRLFIFIWKKPTIGIQPLHITSPVVKVLRFTLLNKYFI